MNSFIQDVAVMEAAETLEKQEMKGVQDSLDDHRIHTIIIDITMYTTS